MKHIPAKLKFLSTKQIETILGDAPYYRLDSGSEGSKNAMYSEHIEELHEILYYRIQRDIDLQLQQREEEEIQHEEIMSKENEKAKKRSKENKTAKVTSLKSIRVDKSELMDIELMLGTKSFTRIFHILLDSYKKTERNS